MIDFLVCTHYPRRVLKSIGLALLFTFGLFLVALIGEFVPKKELPSVNSSEWKAMENVIDEYETAGKPLFFLLLLPYKINCYITTRITRLGAYTFFRRERGSYVRLGSMYNVCGQWDSDRTIKLTPWLFGPSRRVGANH